MNKLRVIAAGLMFVIGTGSVLLDDSSAQTVRQNVLIIVTDDQREGLEVMPKTRAWLQDAGTTYSNAVATTPLCCPARASIFAGRYAHNHGVKQLSPGPFDHQASLQRHLKDNGYTTGIYGKYFNNWNLATSPRFFDEWAIFAEANKSYSGGRWNVQGTVQTVSQYATSFIGDRVDAFLGSSQGPWFLYLAPPNPHPPYSPEAKYKSAPVPTWDGNPAVFEADESDKPAYVRNASKTFTQGRDTRTKQYRSVMSVDDLIDRVMSKLQASGQLDNTIVFFISDNGYMWAEHGLIGKRMPYQQSIRVPMLARGPGLSAGVVDDRLVANIDIAPTVLEAAGIPAPTNPPMDGRSLLSAFTRDRILTESWGAGQISGLTNWASLVTATDQYIEYYNSGGGVTFREYYDLVNDPWQLENTMTPPPGTAAQLAADRVCRGGTCP